MPCPYKTVAFFIRIHQVKVHHRAPTIASYNHIARTIDASSTFLCVLRALCCSNPLVVCTKIPKENCLFAPFDRVL